MVHRQNELLRFWRTPACHHYRSRNQVIWNNILSQIKPELRNLCENHLPSLYHFLRMWSNAEILSVATMIRLSPLSSSSLTFSLKRFKLLHLLPPSILNGFENLYPLPVVSPFDAVSFSQGILSSRQQFLSSRSDDSVYRLWFHEGLALEISLWPYVRNRYHKLIIRSMYYEHWILIYHSHHSWAVASVTYLLPTLNLSFAFKHKNFTPPSNSFSMKLHEHQW